MGLCRTTLQSAGLKRTTAAANGTSGTGGHVRHPAWRQGQGRNSTLQIDLRVCQAKDGTMRRGVHVPMPGYAVIATRATAA